MVGLAVLLPALNQARVKHQLTGSGGQAAGANRELVRQAEETVYENIRALDNLTNQLSRVNDARSGRQAAGQLMQAATRLQLALNRARIVTVRKLELVALKHSIGSRMRSSLTALKQEMTRVDAIPAFRGIFQNGPSEIDQSIEFWTIKPGEETPPQPVNGPAPPIRAGPRPGGGPPGGPPWAPPRHRRRGSVPPPARQGSSP
jgi:hypothetical protein